MILTQDGGLGAGEGRGAEGGYQQQVGGGAGRGGSGHGKGRASWAQHREQRACECVGLCCLSHCPDAGFFSPLIFTLTKCSRA